MKLLQCDHVFTMESDCSNFVIVFPLCDMMVKSVITVHVTEIIQLKTLIPLNHFPLYFHFAFTKALKCFYQIYFYKIYEAVIIFKLFFTVK